MDFLKKVSEYSVTITGLLIVYGYAYYHNFYRPFNLVYHSYANISEILFSFLPILLPLISASFIFSMLKAKNYSLDIFSGSKKLIKKIN